MIQHRNVDFLIGDFVGMSTNPAKQLGIPFAHNIPGPVEACEVLAVNHCNLWADEFITSRFGALFRYKKFMDWLVGIIINKTLWHNSKTRTEYMQGCIRELTIINSVWGFCKTRMLPPNIIMSGPFFEISKNLKGDLRS